MASPAIGTGTGNPKTPIGDQLAALYPDVTDRRRHGFKAAALAERLGSRSFQVSGCVGGRTVTVSGIHVDEVGALVCTITHPDIPEGCNPFRFVNPPVSVPSGVFTLTEAGDEYEGSREDPEEAFRQVVRDVVATVLL